MIPYIVIMIFGLIAIGLPVIGLTYIFATDHYKIEKKYSEDEINQAINVYSAWFSMVKTNQEFPFGAYSVEISDIELDTLRSVLDIKLAKFAAKKSGHKLSIHLSGDSATLRLR